MHELSIAMSIVEMAQEEAGQRSGAQVRARVSAIHLKLGALSGIVSDALRSCYEMACCDTPLEGSRLVIEEVPIMVFCAVCQARRPVSSIQLFCCAVCGRPSSEVVQGKELEVVALEIESWAPHPA